MKKIPYSAFKHGQRVRCTIQGNKIDEAKISISPKGFVYICHNVAFSDSAYELDLLGYTWSWLILNNNEDFTDGVEGVTNLTLLDRTIEDVREGDVVIGEDRERTVLGICGQCVFLSNPLDIDIIDISYTRNELVKRGYTIKQDTPTIITEVTLQEVADKMGVPVEQLRIKE